MRFRRVGFIFAAVVSAAALTGCTVAAAAQDDTPPVELAPAIYEMATVDNTSSDVIRSCNRGAGSGVLLSFDDDGTPEQVRAILKELRTYNAQAAFFPTGDWALKNLDLIDEMQTDGHIVGNHTQTHARLSKLDATNPDEFYAEVYPLKDVANTTPILMRPPYEDGAYNESVRNRLTEKKMQVCTWTADTYDWNGDTVEQMMQRLIVGDTYSPNPLADDGVVLLHMGSKYADKMVGAIVEHLNVQDIKVAPLAK